MEFGRERRRGRETRKRNNDNDDDGRQREVRRGPASPKRLRTWENEEDVGGPRGARRQDVPKREARGRRMADGDVEDTEYQPMCSSQGPNTAGVTWDFSSPSPSQYKKFSQKSYAKREEETNRIAEQMKSDGIRSRFLVGRFGGSAGEKDADVETSSIVSIAALAKLNKKPTGPIGKCSTLQDSPTSIFDEVQRLHLEVQGQKTSKNDQVDNLDLSLDVRPLDVSNDDLGRDAWDDDGRQMETVDDEEVDNARHPQPLPHSQQRQQQLLLGEIVGGAVIDDEDATSYDKEERASTSSGSHPHPKRHPASALPPRSSPTNIPTPHSPSHPPSPSSLSPPRTPSPGNRTFPRPTQSVSPEFPESPRESPENNSLGFEKSRPAALSFKQDVSQRNLPRVKEVGGSCGVGEINNEDSVGLDDDWSDMDDSLFLRTVTQAEAVIKSKKKTIDVADFTKKPTSTTDATTGEQLHTKSTTCHLVVTTAATSSKNSVITTTAVAPLTTTKTKATATAIPAPTATTQSSPSIELTKKRKLSLARKRPIVDEIIDLTFSDEDEATKRTTSRPVNNDATDTNNRHVAVKSVEPAGDLADDESECEKRAFVGAASSSTTSKVSRSDEDGVVGKDKRRSSSLVVEGGVKNPLHLRILMSSPSLLRRRSPSSSMEKPISPIIFADDAPTASSTSFCFSDVDDDFDLSLVEAASQRLDRMRREGAAGDNRDKGQEKTNGVGVESVAKAVEIDEKEKIREIKSDLKNSSVSIEINLRDPPDNATINSPATGSSLASTSQRHDPASRTSSSSNSAVRALARHVVDDDYSPENVRKITETFDSAREKKNRNLLSKADSVVDVDGKSDGRKDECSIWSDDDDDLDDATLAILIEEVESPKNQSLPHPLAQKPVSCPNSRMDNSKFSTNDRMKKSSSFPQRQQQPPRTSTASPRAQQQAHQKSSEAIPASSFNHVLKNIPTSTSSNSSITFDNSISQRPIDPSTLATSSWATSQRGHLPSRVNGGIDVPSPKMYKASSFSVTTAKNVTTEGGFKVNDASTGAARFGKRPASFSNVYKPVVTVVAAASSTTKTTESTNVSRPTSTTKWKSASSFTAASSSKKPPPRVSSTAASAVKFSSTTSFKRHQSAAQLTSHLHSSSSSERLSPGTLPNRSRTPEPSRSSSSMRMSDSLEDIDEDEDDSLFDVFRKADEICQAFNSSQKR